MDDIAVPAFSRLADYFGAWCYEPSRFAAQWQFIQGVDLVAHMRSALPAPTPITRMEGVGGKSQVAIIQMAGTLMKSQSSLGGTSTVRLRQEIRAAVRNPQVSAILLAIDSPGGTVAGTADLAADVKAARRQKPVWAHIDDLGASAAYWIASQAGAVFANSPTALVGSIGTIQTVVDSSAAAEKAGVKVLTFATGPLKGAGTPGTTLSEEQQAYFQQMVDASQLEFDAAVKSGRGMSDAKLSKVRTGGVFLASEAQALGLIDGVRSLDRTLAELAKVR